MRGGRKSTASILSTADNTTRSLDAPRFSKIQFLFSDQRYGETDYLCSNSENTTTMATNWRKNEQSKESKNKETNKQQQLEMNRVRENSVFLLLAD